MAGLTELLHSMAARHGEIEVQDKRRGSDRFSRLLTLAGGRVGRAEAQRAAAPRATAWIWAPPCRPSASMKTSKAFFGTNRPIAATTGRAFSGAGGGGSAGRQMVGAFEAARGLDRGVDRDSRSVAPRIVITSRKRLFAFAAA